MSRFQWPKQWLALATVALTIFAGMLHRASSGPLTSPEATLRERRAIAGEPMAAPRASTQAVGAFKLSLSFEPNRGQASDEARFVSRGRGYALVLGAGGRASLVVGEPRSGAPLRLAVAPAGADPHARAEPLEQLPRVTSYFRGQNPERWLAGIPTYAKVTFRQVYPGIDLIYYGRERELEFDFVVSPGTDPSTIALRYEGAERIEIDAGGSVVIRTAGGELVQRPPIVYQADAEGGHSPVEAAHVLASADEVRFRLGPYDPARTLVIDPVLTYSTHLGGTGFDLGTDVAVDAAGHAYLTGRTLSLDFPTTGAFDGALGGSEDIFVTKLDATGSSVVYSTYLGGSSIDQPFAIAVDSDGNAYVAGWTASADFPRTTGPARRGTGFVGFVTKLVASGSALAYSRYLNGGPINAIEVDPAGYAYLTGNVTSPGFFTATPGVFQPTYGGGGSDAFVAKLDRNGSRLVYSTFLGGADIDRSHGIAVDAQGHAYVTGSTESTNFPVTPGAFQQTGGGIFGDAFVTKLGADGSSLIYSTYLHQLGISAADSGQAIAVDASGAAYVTGYTDSRDFPTTTGAYLRTNFGGDYDAFVTKLHPSGSTLSWSTYFSGFDPFSMETASAIAVDAQGRVVIAGSSRATSFPTAPTGMCSLSHEGFADSAAYVAQFSADGSTLLYADEIGGRGDSVVGRDFFSGGGMAIDGAGDAYFVGVTYSSGFPTTPGFQPSSAGESDAFVLKIALSEPTIETFRAYAGSDLHTGSTTVTLDGSGSCGAADFIWTGPFAEGGTVLGPTPTVTLPVGTHEIQLLVSNAAGGTSTDSMLVTVAHVPLFLHAEDTSLFLDTNAPTDAAADFRDSTSLNFAGGNPWKEIGTWDEPATGSPQTLIDLGDLHVWLGLKNSDDQGTRFDLRAEVLKNGLLIAVGESYCIAGITRNPAHALEALVPFGPIADAGLGPADALSLRVSARIGTDGNGTFCGGHSNAVGLRLYFDAVSRPTQFGILVK